VGAKSLQRNSSRDAIKAAHAERPDIDLLADDVQIVIDNA